MDCPLTPDVIVKYRDERLAEGKSPDTVRIELAVLSHLFTTAIREWRVGLIYNPVYEFREERFHSPPCCKRPCRLRISRINRRLEPAPPRVATSAPTQWDRATSHWDVWRSRFNEKET